MSKCQIFVLYCISLYILVVENMQIVRFYSIFDDLIMGHLHSDAIWKWWGCLEFFVFILETASVVACRGRAGGLENYANSNIELENVEIFPVLTYDKR